MLKEIQPKAAIILKLSQPCGLLDEKSPPSKIYQVPRVQNFPGNKELHLGLQLPPLLK